MSGFWNMLSSLCCANQVRRVVVTRDIAARCRPLFVYKSTTLNAFYRAFSTRSRPRVPDMKTLGLAP